MSVPVATYTGWNLRHRDIGNPDLFIGITGGFAGWILPLPASKVDREASGDPRPSIDELYASKDEYLERVRAASQQLVDEGYLLAEDVEEVANRAELRFDRFRGTANDS